MTVTVRSTSARPLSRALILGLLLAPLPAFADGAFEAPIPFAGTLRVSGEQAGGPIVAGNTVTVQGQGLVAGQKLVLQRGATVLNPGAPLVVGVDGKVSGDFKLPADAAIGIHPIVVIAEQPSAASILDLKVSPLVPVSGADRFEISANRMVRGLYQVAYGENSKALFVTAAVGRPPVRDSALLKVDPTTLEIIARATPAAAPERPRPDPAARPAFLGGAPAAPAAPGPGPGGEGQQPQGPAVYAVYGVGVDDANGTVWVTNTRQNTVAVYKQSDLSLVKQFEPEAVNHSRDVVVDDKRGRAYVSAAMTSQIVVFDTKTLEKTATIDIPSTKRGDEFQVMSLDLDAAGGQLFTVSQTTPEIAVIDVAAGRVTKVITYEGAKGATGVAYDPVTKRIFVSSFSNDNLIIVDSESGKTLQVVPVGAGALNVEFEPVKRLAYVSNRGSGTLTVVDPDGKIVANLDNGAMPNFAAADGKGTVYAVNKGRGEDESADRLTRIRLVK
ncbi:YncE family protein [Zavarzinia compransoris]|uniref:ATP-binding protein n=1 Tax=Zavarzinia compransoris TaxID=1264899 RepID=A0A317DT26_9PROT|nr:glutaminyl-peptide cyclotransferase [Zavarzinia compransoris]PWR17838.1 ATP-binding protein [Zavarzinia compransoris]TDP49373.1 glutamine cyclotransferase [Zavarzinia compransoris]